MSVQKINVNNQQVINIVEKPDYSESLVQSSYIKNMSDFVGVDDSTIVIDILNEGEYCHCCINEISGELLSNAGYCYIYELTIPAKIIYIKCKPHAIAGDYYAAVAFLKEWNTNVSMTYCDGETGVRIKHTDVQDHVLEIPSDCKYIYTFEYYSDYNKNYPLEEKISSRKYIITNVLD